MPTNPRLTRASMALSRRMFLKALALGLSVPLAAKLARVASAAPTAAPKRFFVMYMPDGVPPEHFNPIVSADRTSFALDQTNVSILSPLKPYQSSVNVYQGFKYIKGSTHSSIVSCLSGAATEDTSTPRTSLEHVIAKGLGVKPLILGACAHQSFGLDDAAKLFWDGTAIDPEKNPVAVADRLFGNSTTPPPPNADVQLRSDLLALTASEVSSLQSSLSGLTKETTKLSRHFEAIQALQSGPNNTGQSTCGMTNVLTDPGFAAVNAIRAGAASAPPLDSSGGNDFFYAGANFPMLFQAQLEIVAKALVCNAAQVIGLMPMWPTFELDFGFSQPGTPAPASGWSHHQALSHTGPQAAPGVAYNSPLSQFNLDPKPRETFAKAQLWFVNQLVKYVVSVLATTPDPSGAPGEMVLDNTLIYLMSEIGDGANHTITSATVYPQTPSFIPMVSIGKCGGGIKTGQVVQIAPDKPDPTTDRPAADSSLSIILSGHGRLQRHVPWNDRTGRGGGDMNRSERESAANTEAQVRAGAERSEGRALNRSERESAANTEAQVRAGAERSEGRALNRSERESAANTEAQVRGRAERSEGRALKRHALWIVPSLAAVLAACTGNIGSKDGDTGGSGGGKTGPGGDTVTSAGAGAGSGTAAGGSSSSAGGSSSSAGGSTGTGGPPPIHPVCDPTKTVLGSPMIRLLNSDEFGRTLSDIFPEVAGQWTNSLPADAVSSYGFDNDGAAVVGQQYAGAVLDTATSLATALVAPNVLSTVLPCSSAAADQACAETFLTKYGRRLFRRPLTTDEQNRYLGFFMTSMGKSDFPTALKWMTIGLIQSPNALYRSEVGTADTNGNRQLSPFEITTELAYTYLGSTPTDAMITQAESGTMGNLVTTATSLLASATGRRTLQHFFEGYLEYTKALSMEKPNIGVAGMDSGSVAYDSVRSDMASETRAFIDDIVFQKNQGLKELLTAPTTNPSKSLATYYGFPTPAADYASIPRPAGEGLGILAQGSVLASHSQPDGSSPTQRGLLVFLRLLCETKPTPPPNVPQIGMPHPGVETTRQRYEKDHFAPGSSCSMCHARFDPIGFGFEHFNEGGMFRTDEHSLPIDSAASVPNPDGVLTDAPLFPFQGEEDLVQGLANEPLVYQCFTAYLAAYAYGSGEACLGSSQVADFTSGKVSIATLFTEMAAEPHFISRSPQ